MGRFPKNLAKIAAQTSGVSLFVLYGSRARDEVHARSDWDFAYLAGPSTDVDMLRGELVTSLETDRVDLVDLARAGGLIRYQIARDGVLVFESSDGQFDRFRLEAIQYWCDMATVIRDAYDGALEEMGV